MKHRCEASFVAGVGYGDGDVYECSGPATHRGWETGPWGRERVYSCADHAGLAEGWMRMFRFRRVR